MKKYKFYQQLVSVAVLVLLSNTINAQQRKDIYVEIKKEVEIVFSSLVVEANFVPVSDDHEMEYSRNGKALTVLAKKENTPVSTLTVKEKNGTNWVLTIIYKKGLTESDLLYEFPGTETENNSIQNTILTQTDRKFKTTNQEDAIPYTSDERSQLKIDNPGIDFSKDPPEQVRNLAGVAISPALSDSVYKNRAPLYLAFKDNDDVIKIWLICEDLIFSGNDGFLKLQIKNTGDEAFLTGSITLSLVKSNGSILKIYPGDIYPKQFPVIKPKFHKAIIYSFKAFEVMDEDSLKFEIHDRKQKINLEFAIPGSVYNKVKKGQEPGT